MEEKTLTITVTYIQGIPDWERRVEKVYINGEERSHSEAVSELLKTSQPQLPKARK